MEIDFKLTCSCENEIDGFFGEDDEQEILYCDCGLEWRIKRPIK